MDFYGIQSREPALDLVRQVRAGQGGQPTERIAGHGNRGERGSRRAPQLVTLFCIIDTNVVSAGLITSIVDAPGVRMLDGMLGAAFPFVLSPALLADYRAVLLPPKLTRLHRLAAEQIDTVLTDFARHGIVLSPPVQQAVPFAPDPGDQFL